MYLRLFITGMCLVILSWPAHAIEKRIPVDDFVHEDQFANPRLSPDGKYIAITVRIPQGANFVSTITVYSLPTLQILGAIRMPVHEIPLNYLWVSKTRLVVTKGKELGLREQPIATGEVLAMDFDGSHQEYLYGYDMFHSSSKGARFGDDHGYGYISAIPINRNGHFFLNSYLWQSQHSQLYDIDSINVSRKLIADLPLPYLNFLLQRNGVPRFAYGTDEKNLAVLYKFDEKTEQWDLLDQKKFGYDFLPLAFNSDNTEFTARYSDDGGPNKLIRENAQTGVRTTLIEDGFSSINLFQYGADRGHVPFAASTALGKPIWHYIDIKSADAILHQTLSAQFPDSFVNFINFTDDGNKLLFGVASDRDPGAFYLYDRQSNKADFLFAAAEKINPNQMAERRPIRFHARDGQSLDAYLTVPKSVGNEKMPLVLLPHGGPHGVYDRWFFDRDAQFLASRGYAVLQVNYRGSGGRGQNFRVSGYRQWGAKIQDDLIDGVKWAISEANIDANRICTFGASFGGYSALMLAAREPNMFKCAVGYAGIYDLNLLFDEDRAKRDKQTFNIYVDYIGQDKAELDRFSPVQMADRITIPVMLVHGGNDTVAPPKHAERMRAALVKANHPPEWLFQANEGHGFYDTDHTKDFYQKLEAFLDKHIGK